MKFPRLISKGEKFIMNIRQLYSILCPPNKKGSKKTDKKTKSVSLTSDEYVKLRKNKKSDKKM